LRRAAILNMLAGMSFALLRALTQDFKGSAFVRAPSEGGAALHRPPSAHPLTE
jgi:hypothetical protein